MDQFENNQIPEKQEAPQQSEPEKEPVVVSPYYDLNPPKPKSGFAIASLVLGICSVVLFCCAPVILSVLGLVFGIIACAKKQPKGMAAAGIITSVVGLLLSIVMVVLLFIGSYNIGINILEDMPNHPGYYDNYYDDYGDYYEDYFEHNMRLPNSVLR